MKSAIAYHEIHTIHQILISDEYSAGDPLPPYVTNNIQSVTSLYPDADHKLWAMDDIRDFISRNFDNEVCQAFDKLKAYAYKADLARYCLLYISGGIYADLGIKMMGKWEIPKAFGISAFRELNFTSRSWTILQNGLLWALPGRKELLKSIEWIIQNCERNYYGAGPLYPTGPVLLGRAFISELASTEQSDIDDQWIGEYRWVTPDGAMKNDAYIAPDFSLIGFRTKLIPGDLSHIGLGGTNNYNIFWSRRRMYGEKPKIWTYNDDTIGIIKLEKGADGVSISPEFTGIFNSGPYINLIAGKYFLEVLFGPGSGGDLQVEVFSMQGIGLKYDISVAENGYGQNRARIEFILQTAASSVEFRLFSNGNFSGLFTGFSLTMVQCFDRVWAASDEKQVVLLNAIRHVDGIYIDYTHVGEILSVDCNDIEPGKYVIELDFISSCIIPLLEINIATIYSKNTIRHLKYCGNQERVANVKLQFELKNTIEGAQLILMAPLPIKAALARVSLACEELL